MSAVFEANYPGLCPTCDHAIQPGDLVHYQDDELVHVDHTELAASVGPDGPVCTECWLTKPCEHDDLKLIVPAERGAA